MTIATRLKGSFRLSIKDIAATFTSSKGWLPYEAVYIDKDGNKKVFTVAEGIVSEHIIERGVEGMFKFQAITDTIQADDHVILNPTEAITTDKTVVETEVK